MKCEADQRNYTMCEDEHGEAETPVELRFDWNTEAVAIFIAKSNTVSKEGIEFSCFVVRAARCD